MQLKSFFEFMQLIIARAFWIASKALEGQLHVSIGQQKARQLDFFSPNHYGLFHNYAKRFEPHEFVQNDTTMKEVDTVKILAV